MSESNEGPARRRGRAREGGDAGEAEVADRLHEEQAKGYQGTVPDETPNSAYTVGGVTAHEETPESDENLKEEKPA